MHEKFSMDLPVCHVPLRCSVVPVCDVLINCAGEGGRYSEAEHLVGLVTVLENLEMEICGLEESKLESYCC